MLTVVCIHVNSHGITCVPSLVGLQQDLKPGNLAVNQNCELKVQ